MAYLPDEIIGQILVKVPCLKFILRCTSVCKSWHSLIKSPIFVTLHLNRPNITKYLFCVYFGPLHPKERYLSMHYDNEAFIEYYRLVFPGKKIYAISIHGCCNGLLCYTEYGDRVYLWNPAIRRLKVLPRYPNYENYRASSRSFGFWFDKRVNDYMVAKLSYSGVHAASSIDVYSLSANSWKTITSSIPGTSKMQRGFELACVDGTLHWPSKTREGWMIFSLDIKSGMFRDTLISWGSDRKLSDFYLTPLVEHSFIAVYGSRFTGSNSIYRCCMVQVYDQHLNKLYAIDLEKDTRFNLERGVGFRNNGEALFPKLERYDKLNRPNDSGIVSFSTQTKECKEFVKELDYNVRTISTKEHRGRIFYQVRRLCRVKPFIETLVLLNDGDAKETSTPSYNLTLFENTVTEMFDFNFSLDRMFV